MEQIHFSTLKRQQHDVPTGLLIGDEAPSFTHVACVFLRLSGACCWYSISIPPQNAAATLTTQSH